VSWTTVPASELMVKRGGSINPSKHPEEVFDLLSIAAFDTGEVEVLQGSEIGSSKSCVEPNDVLLSKIVPHIRRCWVVPARGPNRQIGSGEWIIFRDDRFNSGFLKHFLTSDRFHAQFLNTVAGVGGSLVRARPAFVEKIDVPLPTMEEQKRIAAILDKADNLRRKRQQAIQLADEFLRAVFLDMFGDPVRNQKQYETSNLGSVADFVAGSTLPPTKEYCGQDEGIAAFKVGDMNCAGNEHFLTIPREWAETFKNSNALVPSGTIVFPKRGGAIGTNKKRITKGQAILDPNLMGVIPGMELTLDYLFSWFQLLDLSTITSGSSVPQLNKRDLDPLKVIIPPRPEMDKYSAICKQFRSWKSCLTRSDKELGILFNSLNQRAFSGSL